MSGERWATFGSIGSAAASSACCWLPLIMVATGFSVAGASAFFESYRPLFLTVAVVLLATGFYLNYRPRQVSCGSDGTCPPKRSWLTLFNRGLLWVSALVVAALAFFPNYVDRAIPASAMSPDRETGPTLVLDIDGMTCAGCEAAVETALLELEEVRSADVSYEDAQGVVQLGSGSTPSQMALRAAVGRAGYTLIGVSLERSERGGGATPETAAEDSSLVIPLSGDAADLRERFNAEVEKTR